MVQKADFCLFQPLTLTIVYGRFRKPLNPIRPVIQLGSFHPPLPAPNAVCVLGASRHVMRLWGS
jgi:hypothetical protein